MASSLALMGQSSPSLGLNQPGSFGGQVTGTLPIAGVAPGAGAAPAPAATNQDTGLKPKSRWFYRCEQETSLTSTGCVSSTSTVTMTSSQGLLDTRAPLVTTVTAGPQAKVVATFSANSSNFNCSVSDLNNVVSLPSFEYIKDNIYLILDKKKSKKGKESRLICECTKEEAIQSGHGCGDECLNRLLYYECGPNCPCGSLCTNVRFQRFEYADVEPFPAGKKGFGLRAVKDIEKHTFVIEYVGEVLTASQFRHRCKQYAKDPKHSHHYFMALKSDEVIDATKRGNISRFMNHSCEPNCETQKWTVNGHLRIGFFTIKDVKVGEELTFDYKFQRYGKEAQKCFCGAPTCRGYIDAGDSAKKIDKEEKKKEKEPKTLFEDSLLDREFDDILSIGCLRNRDHVVTFGRLMLRADDYDSRRKLIDLLLKTGQPILRLFIDLHGCTLLWSWMVDDEACAGHWPDFQLKILSVLKILPIPHKNILYDSRVFLVVERWSQMKLDSLLRRSEKVEEIVRDVLSKIINKICDEIHNGDAENTSNDSLSNSAEDMLKKAKEIKAKSESLLKQWSTLKENFKIPKKPEKDKKDDKSNDRKLKTKYSPPTVLNKSKNSTSSKSDSKHEYSSKTSSRYSRKKFRSRSRSRSRSKEKRSSTRRDSCSSDKNSSYRYISTSSSSRSRLNSTSGYSRYGGSLSSKDKRQKRFHSRENSDSDSSAAKKLKDERRRQFEEKIAREEEQRIYDRQLKDFEMEVSKLAASEQMTNGPTENSLSVFDAPQNLAPQTVPSAGPTLTPGQLHQHQQQQAIALSQSAAATFWQTASQSAAGVVPGSLPRPVPPPSVPKIPAVSLSGSSLQTSLPAELVFDPSTGKYWWRDRSTGVFVYPANEQQVTMYLSGDNSCIPHFYHDKVTGLIHEVQMRMPLTTANVLIPTNYATQDDRNEIDMVCEDELLPRDQRISIVKNQILSLRNQLAQKEAELKWLLEQESEESSTSRSDEGPARPPSRLPKNWRMAQDTDGKPYYYHIYTKQTQWDPPVCADDEEEDEEYSPTPCVHSTNLSKHCSSSSSSGCHGNGHGLQPKKQPIPVEDSHARHRHKRNRDRIEQQRKMKAALKIKNAAFSSSSKKIHQKGHETEPQPLAQGQPKPQPVPAPVPAPEILVPKAEPAAINPKAEPSDSNTSGSMANIATEKDEKTPKKEPEPIQKMVTVKTEITPTPLADSSFSVTPFGTTTAAADTSSEVAKRLKENFKSSISNHIIKCLNPYRKSDCKNGHITNNDDFKHIARKLTHAIMEKELKHCQRVEDLRLTDSVLHKAKDYIKRYMLKLGAVYKRAATSP